MKYVPEEYEFVVTVLGTIVSIGIIFYLAVRIIQ